MEEIMCSESFRPMPVVDLFRLIYVDFDGRNGWQLANDGTFWCFQDGVWYGVCACSGTDAGNNPYPCLAVATKVGFTPAITSYLKRVIQEVSHLVQAQGDAVCTHLLIDNCFQYEKVPTLMTRRSLAFREDEESLDVISALDMHFKQERKILNGLQTLARAGGAQDPSRAAEVVMKGRPLLVV